MKRHVLFLFIVNVKLKTEKFRFGDNFLLPYFVLTVLLSLN